MQWYTINNLDNTDTPALVLYKERIQENIHQAISLIKNSDHLRPHVKTNKIAEVCRMMMDAGIRKFKCATIAEAEMLGMIEAKDVLMAYQPVGPKAKRLIELILHYPATQFSCLVDSIDSARSLSELFSEAGLQIRVYIDLNTGMNRTGIKPSDADDFLEALAELPSLFVAGVHVYDGHLTEPDISLRQEKSDKEFSEVNPFINSFGIRMGRPAIVVTGGSATFPTHIKRNVECSPGTFVFWDWGYKHRYVEEPFEYAALVLTRIISIVSDTLITTDLGYKAVASENPLPRVHFLNAPQANPLSQSEEHLSLQVPDSSCFKIGDVLYGVPVHICPTVALYDKAFVVEKGEVIDSWKVIARDRVINF